MPLQGNKNPIKALVFDFGNALLSWKPLSQTRIPKALLKRIMASNIWADYERGRFDANECFTSVETQFGCPEADLRALMKVVREILQVNEHAMSFIKYLKESHPDLEVYGMINAPKPEQDHIHSTCELWPIFDNIFISSDVGMRKPDLYFYNHVLEQIDLPGDLVVVVDNLHENVLSALSLGMRAIHFSTHDELCHQLLNNLDDPVTRGLEFLDRNAKTLDSITNQGHVIKDNFSQLLILEMTGRSDLLELEPGKGSWNFFIGGPHLTTERYPDDFDTTSLALTIIPMDDKVVETVMDEMLTYVSEDGIVTVYFDRARPRTDPVVCVNVLNLFLKHDRQDELKPTWEWVMHVLENRAYIHGTRYYPSADSFLFFMARLTRNIRSASLKSQLLPRLQTRVMERIGEAGDSVALGMRVMTCKILKIPNTRDLDRLRRNIGLSEPES